MQTPEELLEDLAGAVSDGAPVNWPDAERSASEAMRPFIRSLGVVALIATAHRGADRAPVTTVTEPQTPVATPPSWAHLRLIERVGGGAFGEVFRAWDTRLEREVALKLLSIPAGDGSAGAEALIEEGRLLARVRHPNVVAIYGAERVGDRVGLWMEFVRGRTLEQLLRDGKSLSPQEVASIGVEVCRAIGAVHAAGVLHRDIKAQNVTQADDGRVVLMDFGTGRRLEEPPVPDMAGTPLYLAPEVLTGCPATVQSDIYSVGVLLFHLLTGAYPVQARSIADVRDAHASRTRVPLHTYRADLPQALARIVDRALDADPVRRYATADAMAADLVTLSSKRAKRWLLAGGVLVLVLTAIVAWFGARGPADPATARLVTAGREIPDRRSTPIVAVLPFVNDGTEADSALVVDSLTDGLIQQLAAIDGLQVRSQTSSRALKGLPRNLEEIGRRLQVNLVVEGAARLSDDTLRIQAALVAVPEDKPLWSVTLNRQVRSVGDLTAALDDLTRTIADRLRLKLGRTQRRYGTDLATYDIFLRAQSRRGARGRDALAAVPLYEEVIRRDPGFAPAYAGLAATYGSVALNYPIFGGFALAPSDAIGRMRPLVRTTLDLDPFLPEAHAAMAYLHSFERHWADAERSFRRAIALDPTLSVVYGDLVLSTLMPWGRVDDALKTMMVAREVDPLSLDVHRVLATVQLSAGLYQEALANCHYVLSVDPEFPFAAEWCGRALFQLGRQAEALERFRENPERNEGFIGYVLAQSGRRVEAEALATKNAALPQRQAMIYAGLGDKTRAFEALERLAALNPRRAGSYLTYPELAVLRGDPRVTALRQAMGFPEPGIQTQPR